MGFVDNIKQNTSLTFWAGSLSLNVIDPLLVNRKQINRNNYSKAKEIHMKTVVYMKKEMATAAKKTIINNK